MEEKEIKVLLTSDQYCYLLKELNWDKEFTQDNYYYLDKEKELIKKNITFRVRKKYDKCFMQIKMPISNKGSIRVAEEVEKEIYEVPDIIEAKEWDNMTGIDAPRVYKIGKLTTKRNIIKGINYEIALDQNMYLGKEDFELEIEYTGDIPQICIDQINSLVEIDWSIEVKGKNSRFMKQYFEEASREDVIRLISCI